MFQGTYAEKFKIKFTKNVDTINEVSEQEIEIIFKDFSLYLHIKNFNN